MGHKLIRNNAPKKESFFKEHKETIIIMFLGFAAIIFLVIVLLVDKALDKRDRDRAMQESLLAEVTVTNPYEEGQGEYYAFIGHEKEVTAVLELDDFQDGTKVWWVAYADGWTAFVYLTPDGESHVEIESIP